jgi:hypothetical protein
MKKITIIAIAAAVLSAHPARAETATSRAIVACENLSKLDERNTCLGRIPNCKVVLTRDFDDATQGVHWHNGKEFDIDGGSEDLGNPDIGRQVQNGLCARTPKIHKPTIFTILPLGSNAGYATARRWGIFPSTEKASMTAEYTHSRTRLNIVPITRMRGRAGAPMNRR